MSMKSKILAGLLLLVFSTAHAEEIARMYPDGTGDGMENIVTARASSVTGIDMLGKIQTYGTNEPSYNQGNLQSLPVAGWTNYHPYSYDVANWTTNYRLDITSPTLVTDPAGTVRGFPFIPTAETGAHAMTNLMTGLTDNTIYTWSVYVKPGTPISGQTKVWCSLRAYAKDHSYNLAYFNLTDKTIGTNSVPYSGIDGPFYGGYYRIWIGADTLTGASEFDLQLYIAESDGDVAFTGDNSTVSFWAYGANVVLGTAPLPDIPTNGAAVSVAGQTLTADISTNTALRDALSDAIGGATSVFTMLTKITPRVALANISGDPVVLTPGLSIDSTTDDFAVLDGTNTALANDADADPIAGTERWIKVTGDSEADGGTGEIQICDSIDSGVTWACGTKVAYDGALAFANDFTIAGTLDFGGAQFYNTILTDAEATAALSCNQKVLRLLH
jgi:hypothetical protein